MRSKKRPERPERDPLKVSDIQGAKAKGPYLRNEHFDTFTYADVYAKSWTSKRVTDPLNPSYIVRDDQEPGHMTRGGDFKVNKDYGKIEKSFPQALPPAIAGVRNLTNEDIVGSKAGTKNLGMFTFYQRRN